MGLCKKDSISDSKKSGMNLIFIFFIT